MHQQIPKKEFLTLSLTQIFLLKQCTELEINEWCYALNHAMNYWLYFFSYIYDNESKNISNINSFIPTTSSFPFYKEHRETPSNYKYTGIW